MADVDPLVLKISAEFGTIKEDLARLNKEIKGTGSSVDDTSKSFERMKSGAMAAATAIIAISSAAGMLAKKQLEAAKASAIWADNLNVSKTTFSQISEVGKKFGASMEDVGNSIKNTNERIADAARGNKTYQDSLAMVGLRTMDLISLPVADQFLKVADAIGKMSNAGDRNFATANLMGDAGFKLIPMFQKGETAIRGMGSAMIDTNNALSQYEAMQLEEANKALLDIGRSVEALGNALAIHLGPGLKLAAQWAKELASAAADALGTSKTAMRDRLKEVNAELKKLSHIKDMKPLDNVPAKGQMFSSFAEMKNMQGQQGQAAAKYNEELKKKIALQQEQVKLEQSLASIEESKITKQTAENTPPSMQGGTSLSPITVQGDKGAMYPDPADIPKDVLLANIESYYEEMSALRNAKRQQEEAEHQAFLDREFGAEARNAARNKKLWETSWEGKRKVTSEFLGQISQLMNTNSRKQFEIGKAAAMAQVLIDTPKAAMSAYSAMAGIPIVGPALGAAAAAVAVATGVAQLQNLSAQSFGGGGGMTSGAVGGAGSSSQSGYGNQSQQNVIDATFNVQGTSVSKDQLRGLASGLNELVEDGAKLRSVRVI